LQSALIDRIDVMLTLIEAHVVG